MLKQKISLIIIITILCGLIAGSVAFYRQGKQSKSLSIDIISTITPVEQEKNVAISVLADPMQFNQTFASVINQVYSNSHVQTVSCQADLNSTIIHCVINAVVANFDFTNLDDRFIGQISGESQKLVSKHYLGKIESHLSILKSATSSPSSSSNPYLITFLGLIVGYFLAIVALNSKIRKEA